VDELKTILDNLQIKYNYDGPLILFVGRMCVTFEPKGFGHCAYYRLYSESAWLGSESDVQKCAEIIKHYVINSKRKKPLYL